jgi:hypothetical protein
VLVKFLNMSSDQQAREIEQESGNYNLAPVEVSLTILKMDTQIITLTLMPRDLKFEIRRNEQRRLSMSSSRPLEEDNKPPPHQEAPQRVKELSLKFRTSFSPIKMPTFPPSSSRRQTPILPHIHPL